MSCTVTTTSKNVQFQDIPVSQEEHEHIQQGNDGPFCSYDPIDSPGTLVDIAGTNSGHNHGPTVTDNVTASIVDTTAISKTD